MSSSGRNFKLGTIQSQLKRRQKFLNWEGTKRVSKREIWIVSEEEWVSILALGDLWPRA